MIRITDLKLLETTNHAYETYNSKYEKDTTSLYVTLPASSSMTYEVTITNKNNLLMYRLKEILPLINNNPNVNIKYSIKSGDCINANESKVFTITLTNNSSSEQVLTLVSQYQLETANWIPLETKFLSTDATGDLDINKEGVIYEISVTNSNSFAVDYAITADNSRFNIFDDETKNNTFQIEPNTTINHQVRITLRDDVAYEHFVEKLKLILKSTSPITNNNDIKTVTLNLPQYFNTIILNSMPIKDSPESFTATEATNGYLFRINEMTSSSYTYYYRGIINDNYVLFADRLWRVVRIDAHGNLRIVLNKNVSTKSQYNQKYISNDVQNIEQAINLVDYRQSDVRKNVEEWYTQNIKYVVNSNFCIDLSYQDPIDTQYKHTVYYFTPYLHVGKDANSFTPDFTCSKENVFTSPVGLLSAEEILVAGSYWDLPNYNYYLYNPNITDSQTSWTMSGSYYSLSEKQAGVIVFNQDNRSLFDWGQGGNMTQHYGYRPVISIHGNVKILGDGTIDNPYQIFNENEDGTNS